MVEVLRQVEAVPETYPDAPAGLSTNAAALAPAMVWARIEAYTSYRYTARAVTWTIEGETGGEFRPPLSPVTSLTSQKWWDASWTAVDLLSGPLGYCLPSDGTFLVSAMVGGGTPPAPVQAAYSRLAEYLADAGGPTDRPGAARFSRKIGESLSFDIERNPAWLARAVQNSGAGDLLRPFRRVA